jgi:phage terminase Nu1 subunit (DNA packaging protein)
MKVSEYYGSDAKSRKERRLTKDKAEVQELKKKVESLEKIVDPTKMSKLVDEKLQEKLR